MARYQCPRCGVTENTTNPPHLCADIAARLKRRERQVQAVLDVLHGFNLSRDRDVAEAIVAKLNQLGVTED